MKRTLLALALAALLGSPALAAAVEERQMTADQVIGYTQWTYPGRVLAARYDRSEAEHPHYHVEVLFKSGRVVAFAVDAVNGNFAPVPQVSEQPQPPMSLEDAIGHVMQKFEGEVIAAEFDGTTRTDPHYHVDVKLTSGHVIPVRVEPNGTLQWRETVARQ